MSDLTLYRKSCLSLSWLVCQSMSKMSKSCKTADPGVLLYSCNLLFSFTFIHFHSLSFTFFTFIHFHLLSSPSFTSNFHPFIHSLKCLFIINVHSYILSQPGTHIGFFSQLKRVTLIHQMKLKFLCHTFKRQMEKIKKKAEFTPILVSRD